MKYKFKNSSFTLLLSIVLIASGGITTLRAQSPQSAKIALNGVVSDMDGPIIGASVSEKGNAGNGVATDAEGRFTIRVSSDAVLVVSYLGYATQEVAVGGRTSINITLIDDSQALEEVVVVAYGTQKKRDLTGSVVSLKAEAIGSPTATANFVSLLQGQAAGVSIQNSSGRLGADADVKIRGVSFHQRRH